MTQILNISGGNSSSTVTIPSTQVDNFNVQSVLGTIKGSPITQDISFSFLTRTANFDITLTAGMSIAQIITAISVPGVTVVDDYITLDAALRPLVVVGFTKDLAVLGPLLGLEAPENCISGLSFSYPINGLVFPLPMAVDADQALMYVTMNTNSVIVNTIPNSWDINNRYVPVSNPVTTITVGFISIYGFPILLDNNVTVVLKLN